ncbi:MAG TPA: pyruvate kinase [Clostridia bacterium]|nr:pyruvate kinase [Clostridia bacterium]
MRKTKIICTLGPSTDDPRVLEQLIRNGMDVARINFSHGSHAEHQKRIDLLKSLREKIGRPVALLMDTSGPEIRLGLFKDGKAFLKKGSTFIFTNKSVMGDDKISSVSFKDLYIHISPGQKIFMNDGLIEAKVDKVVNGDVYMTILNDGELSDHKSINIPAANLDIPALSQKDIDDLIFAIKNDFDIIAASFIRKANDIIKIKKVLEQNGCNDMLVIAKIENKEGVENFEEILRVSDGIMVARGDLGVEMDAETVPSIQKIITKKCYLSGKPVIVATQMLESMITNPRPTRAEVSDIANAIYDGASTIMLSGETAAGRYPVEAFNMMSKIAVESERNINYWKRFATADFNMNPSIVNAISHATCMTAMDLKATAILTVTLSGNTARFICRFRPACPVIATTTSEKVCRQLMISWGVLPYVVKHVYSTDEMFDQCVEKALESGLVKSGDITVITGGMPVGTGSSTNMLKVQIVGKVILQGKGLGEGIINGKTCVAHSLEEAEISFTNGDILVIPESNNGFLHLIKNATAVIVDDEAPNSHAVISCVALNIPIIYGVRNATKTLRSGLLIACDMSNGQVYCADTACVLPA